MRWTRIALILLATVAVGVLLRAQGSPPSTPLVVLSADAKRTLPTTVLNGQELLALHDLATLFNVVVREDPLVSGVTVTYMGRSIVMSPTQATASVNGRLVTLPAPLIRSGQRWLVPVEFLDRALAPIYDSRIVLRKTSRLLILGDLRVPFVTARIERVGTATRLVLDVSPATPMSATVEERQVLVRIDADHLDARLPETGAGLIEDIRLSDQPGTLGITIRPGAGPVRTMPRQTPSLTQLTVDIAAAEAVPPAAARAPSAPAAVQAQPSAGVRTIAIDAGHGGSDAGAIGPDGLQEKQLTLDVARRLKDMIETELGLRVVMTRSDDRTVGLDERTAIANNSKADIFLSLHANAALGPSASGAEVFYLNADPAASGLGRADEWAVLPVVGGGERQLELVSWDRAQARHIESSAVFATMLQESLGGHVPMSLRPLRTAPLRVLVSANMPAALIEMGYLTSAADARALASPEFQSTFARAIYDSITRFRAHSEGAP